jgi:hypothetical protein
MQGRGGAGRGLKAGALVFVGAKRVLFRAWPGEEKGRGSKAAGKARAR